MIDNLVGLICITLYFLVLLWAANKTTKRRNVIVVVLVLLAGAFSGVIGRAVLGMAGLVP